MRLRASGTEYKAGLGISARQIRIKVMYPIFAKIGKNRVHRGYVSDAYPCWIRIRYAIRGLSDVSM